MRLTQEGAWGQRTDGALLVFTAFLIICTRYQNKYTTLISLVQRSYWLVQGPRVEEPGSELGLQGSFTQVARRTGVRGQSDFAQGNQEIELHETWAIS